MSLFRPANFTCFNSFSSVSPFPEPDVGTRSKNGALCFEGTKERIKKMFEKVELSVSAYDTAWMALVPTPNCLKTPLFPECINWLLDNQLPDGSWGFLHPHPILTKATLLSTLACLLPLKRWDIGQEHMIKGLNFIESNLDSATDEKQRSPIGFDIIFPGMIEYAKTLELNLPLTQMNVDALIHRRELELNRSNSEGRKAYLAYVSEGIGELQDWDMVMNFQRKNGSLFNSPSTTAAAFMNLNNDSCLDYLHSLLQKFGNAVPTIYPLDTYAQLCMVDSLQTLGIDHHFKEEIGRVLDKTYRYWLQGEENILLDASTCAMAFRMLRVYGYEVSSDQLAQFSEDRFSDCLGGYLKDIGSVLELFKASQITIYPEDPVLENINSWTSHFLNYGLSSNSIHSDRLHRNMKQEVPLSQNNPIEVSLRSFLFLPLIYRLKQNFLETINFGQFQVISALDFTYNTTLERLQYKSAIEHYSVNNIRILKTPYSCLNLGHQDFLRLAMEDFNVCQCIHRQEKKDLERWVVENKLDKLIARQKLVYCYFTAAAAITSPELSDARLSWAKNGVLTTVVDDLFDVWGSEDERINLVQAVERWDVCNDMEYCSEKVEIIFKALHSTVDEIGNKALTWQGRCVTSHVADIWLELIRSMRQEAEWLSNKAVPSMDDYMENGYISFALGPIVLPALYFIGPKLSEEVVGSFEYHNLFKLMSTCGRLLNDVQTIERESSEGKLNALSLHMINTGGNRTNEEVIRAIEVDIDKSRRELLRLVLQEKDSTIPRACKDLFWRMSCVVHLFYRKDDGFTSLGLMNSAKALFEEPISFDNLWSG